jgi:peptidoglycan/LPS O-acetylase OafA/YrhL
VKILVWIAAYLLFNYHVIMTSVADFFRLYSFEHILNEFSIVAGSILIIIITLSSKGFQRFLLVKPLRFLGKISYSLYLFHLPILFSLIYLFYDSIPYWIIVVITFPLTLLLSNVSWNYIEKPSINYGKTLISKLKNTAKKRLVSSKEL